MKAILFNLIFLFLSLCLHAQNTFFKIYETPEDDITFDAEETENGCYILIGKSDSSASGSQAEGYILKINNYGELTDYSKSNNPETDIFFSTINKIPGTVNNFMISGRKDSLSINNEMKSYLILLELDENLDTISLMNSFDGINRVFSPEKALFDNTGSIYILGFSYTYPDFEVNISMTKSLPPYKNAFSKIYGYDGNSYPFSLIYNPVESHLKAFYQGNLIKNSSLCKILEVDTNLEFIYSSELPGDFVSQLSSAAYDDTTYIVTGTGRTPTTSRSILMDRSKFLNNDTICSFRYFISPDTVIYSSLNNTVVTDSFIYVTGVYNLEPFTFPWQHSPTWILITKMNKNFEIISHHFIGGDLVYNPYNTIETTDGGLLITGGCWNYNVPEVLSWDPFALKVNSDGVLVGIENQNNSKCFDAIVYPNPGDQFINIKSGHQIQNAVFSLFDLNGKIILEKGLDQSNISISTGFILPGIYPWKITFRDKDILQGKWIKK